MDDGSSVKTGGVTLCTDNFSEEEVYRLKTVLEINFKFTCTIQKRKPNKPTIKKLVSSSETKENDPQLLAGVGPTPPLHPFPLQGVGVSCGLLNETEVTKANLNKRIYYRIYISGINSPLLYSLVSEFMCPEMLYKINYEIKPVKPLSMTRGAIRYREETIRIQEWKKEHGADSIPPKKGRVLSMTARAIKERNQRALLKISNLPLPESGEESL